MKKKSLLIVLITFFITMPFLNLNLKSPIELRHETTEENPKSSNIDLEWSYRTSGQSIYQGVSALDISSDGSYIVVGTAYSVLYLFEKTSNVPIWAVQEPFVENEVNALSISSDGEYIAAGFQSGNVYAFHRCSGVPIWTYSTGDIISDVEISSDGKYIVVGSYNDGKVCLFNTTNDLDPLLWNYTANSKINSVAISADGTYFVAGSWDFNVYLFNNSGPSLMWNFTALDEIADVDISSDGEYIIAGSLDRGVYLFNKSSSNPIWSYITQGYDVLSVAISDDGNYFAATTWGSPYYRLYSFSKSETNPLWVNTYYKIIRYSLTISSDGKYISVSDYSEGVSFIYLTENPTPLWTFDNPLGNVGEISENNKYFLFGSGGDQRYIYLFKNNPPTLSSDADSPDDDGSFNLFWDSLESFDNYSIYQHDSYISEINGTVHSISEGVGNLSYSLEGLATGDYYYVVVAHNETDNFTSNCIHIVVQSPPLAFTLYSNADVIDIDGSFDLNWDESVSAKNYSVFIHNDLITEINGSVTERASGIESLIYPISGLSNGDYYFVVVSFNDFGNTTSNWIKISVRIPPKPFTLETDADDPDPDGIFNLNWEESIGADNYSVYMHNSPIEMLTGSETLVAEGIIDLTYQISELISGDYYFVVIAYNETGSTLSNYVHVNIEISIPAGREGQAIPFGNYFLVFILIGLISLILIKKRSMIKLT